MVRYTYKLIHALEHTHLRTNIQHTDSQLWATMIASLAEIHKVSFAMRRGDTARFGHFLVLFLMAPRFYPRKSLSMSARAFHLWILKLSLSFPPSVSRLSGGFLGCFEYLELF